MKVLVIGGSRGIGRETVKALAREGRVPVVLARSPFDSGLSGVQPDNWVRGDARDAAVVAAALDGVDAVIVTLGISNSELFGPVTIFSEATRVLVGAMKARGLARLIVVTGFGAGRSRDRIAAWQRLPFDCLFGRAYRDKDVQERLIIDSGLEWTIVRPGVLTNGPATGRYKVLTEVGTWRNGMISRQDVAAFLARQVSDPALIKRDVVLLA